MHLPERVKKLENVEYLGNYEKNLNVRSNVLIGMNILMFEWMLKNVEGVSRQKKKDKLFFQHSQNSTIITLVHSAKKVFTFQS